MRVLFAGRQRKGSWEVRAQQIVAAHGPGWECAHEIVNPKRFDLVVAVKKPPLGTVEICREAGVPCVLDIVDGWKQPVSDIVATVAELKATIAAYDAVIYPCRQMSTAFPHPQGRTIYHHFMPRAQQVAMRHHVTTVGYMGSPRYLGQWETIFRSHAASAGASFVINPPRWADIDVVLAVRAPPYDDILSASYKSNIKLANAIGWGVPPLFFPEPSYLETIPTSLISKCFFTDSRDLLDKLKAMSQARERRLIVAALTRVREQFSINTIVGQYEEFFREILCEHEKRRPRQVANGRRQGSPAAPRPPGGSA